MQGSTGNFIVTRRDADDLRSVIEKDSIDLGRLKSTDVVLDHPSVSRIHARIQYEDGRYSIFNLSEKNRLSINGRILKPQKNDVLADGDTIQIGPFTIAVARDEGAISLGVRRSADVAPAAAYKATEVEAVDQGGVLDVFWEKRSRDEKEDWGTRLRPTEKPIPGKAMFNWRPTGDLRRPWAQGLFVWSILLIGALAAFAYFKYPSSYAPKPLSNPHAAGNNASLIAAKPNLNSCTTCHAPDRTIESACITCHTAEHFLATNTRAHQQAGVTCLSCHSEHQGPDHSLNASAIRSCAGCHNDNNTATYNGKSVRTPHGGSYGYPVVDGVWKWKGVYREVADAIPEISSSATGDKDEQAKLSRQFHTIHVARLKVPEGLVGDKNGLVSCSTCHKSFDPIDRVTPKQTCAACHTNAVGDSARDSRFTAGQANCISCHVQHPYSTERWSEFLSNEALDRRNTAVAAHLAPKEQ